MPGLLFQADWNSPLLIVPQATLEVFPIACQETDSIALIQVLMPFPI